MSISFDRESSFFKECFPIKDTKNIRKQGRIAKIRIKEIETPGTPLIIGATTSGRINQLGRPEYDKNLSDLKKISPTQEK